MSTQSIVYHRNGLGNFIEFTPAMRAVASLDPSGKTDLCVDSEWKDNRRQALLDIANNLPFVENIINFPNDKFDKNYTTWYWTRHTYPSKALEFFKAKDRRFDIGVEWINSKQHEIDFYVNLTRRFLVFTAETPKQYFPIVGDSILKPGKLNIALCNGSYGHLRGSKTWGGFAELSETLKNYYDCNIIKIGYEKELEEVKVFDIDLIGKATILQTAMAIHQSDLLITTDSCNMHIADALNKKMIVLWGGSIFTKNKPVNGTATIISKGLGCQPCHETGKYNSCIAFSCLNNISIGDVMKEVRAAINAN